MLITFNGEQFDTQSFTVRELLDDCGVDGRGVAVAVDGAIVPRSQWSESTLREGAVVEVVTAAAGG